MTQPIPQNNNQNQSQENQVKKSDQLGRFLYY